MNISRPHNSSNDDNDVPHFGASLLMSPLSLFSGLLSNNEQECLRDS